MQSMRVAKNPSMKILSINHDLKCAFRVADRWHFPMTSKTPSMTRIASRRSLTYRNLLKGCVMSGVSMRPNLQRGNLEPVLPTGNKSKPFLSDFAAVVCEICFFLPPKQVSKRKEIILEAAAASTHRFPSKTFTKLVYINGGFES